MEGPHFDESAFFCAIAKSGARALLIGRRALVALGIPVMTADYDFWVHPEDIESFNKALRPLDLRPNREPTEALERGRYVLENDEHVDVIVARSISTTDQGEARFDDLWTRRRSLTLLEGVDVAVPCIDDLILTKRFSARPKDAEDVRLLQILREQERPQE